MTHSILITGGVGFIGQHLMLRLLSNPDCRITIVDNLSNSSKDPVKGRGRVSFYQEDIRNHDVLRDIVNQERVDSCVHLAAKISVSESITDPFATMDINVNGTLSVLEACSKAKIKHFVFASSAAVYGNAKVLPVPEESVLHPLSPYGASKIAGESLVTSYANAGKIGNAVSLRFFNVYGNGQSPEYAGVITKFAASLDRNEAPIIYGDGKQSRDFVYVEDVADATVLALHRDVSGVFNVGTGKPITIEHLARQMSRAYGSSLAPKYVDAKEGDIIHSTANVERSKNLLGFVANGDMVAFFDRLARTRMMIKGSSAAE